MISSARVRRGTSPFVRRLQRGGLPDSAKPQQQSGERRTLRGDPSACEPAKQARPGSASLSEGARDGVRGDVRLHGGLSLGTGMRRWWGESRLDYARFMGGSGGSAPRPCFAGATTREAGAPLQNERAQAPWGAKARGGGCELRCLSGWLVKCVVSRVRPVWMLESSAFYFLFTSLPDFYRGRRSPCGARDAGLRLTNAPGPGGAEDARGVGAAEWHPATPWAAARGKACGRRACAPLKATSLAAP